MSKSIIIQVVGSFVLLATLLSTTKMYQAMASTTSIVFPQPTATTPPCYDITVSQALSPDKAWNAVEYSEFCQGDYTFQTSVVTIIKLVSTSNPKIISDVFAFDTGGHKTLNPTFSWANAHSLQISTVHSTYITLQKNSFSGVPISYNYH